MTANAPTHPPFPVRGTPEGWADIYDDPDDSATLRAEMEDAGRRLLASVARSRRRLEAERRRRERERQRQRRS